MNTFLDPRYADTGKNVGPIDMGPVDEEDKLLIEWIRASLPKAKTYQQRKEEKDE